MPSTRSNSTAPRSCKCRMHACPGRQPAMPAGAEHQGRTMDSWPVAREANDLTIDGRRLCRATGVTSASKPRCSPPCRFGKLPTLAWLGALAAAGSALSRLPGRPRLPARQTHEGRMPCRKLVRCGPEPWTTHWSNGHRSKTLPERDPWTGRPHSWPYGLVRQKQNLRTQSR